MAETGKIKIKNGETEYVKFGQGEKILVILPGLSYDGFFQQAEIIEKAYAVFRKNFTVYLIDRNITPKTGYSVRDIAEDTAESLNELGIKKADFFGASLGGMVAQELAIIYPNLINKLVLCSTLSRTNQTFSSVLTRWKNLAENGDINAAMHDMNNNIYSPYTLKKYRLVFDNINLAATPEKTARFIAYIRAAKDFNVYNSLDKINADTFVISALKDRITTVYGAREIVEKLNCKYCEYKKYGHAVFDEAKGVKSLVYRFLTQE